MQRILLILLAAVAVMIFGTAQAASAHTAVSIDFFYDSLAPYGQWVTVDPYGDCWVPYDMPVGWQPYSDGQWVYTDYGWMWASDYDWGWAPFHYGTWVWLDPYGWSWVPGSVWAPAWVAWCESDGYIGWEPLPYGAEWDPDEGLVTSSVQFGFTAHSGWTFVRAADFTSPRVCDYRLADPYPVFRRGHVFTDYRYENDHVYDGGIPVRNIEQRTGRRVAQYTVVDRGPSSRPNRDVIRGRDIVVTRSVPERYGRSSMSQVSRPPRTFLPPARQQRPPQRVYDRPPSGQRPRYAGQRPRYADPQSGGDRQVRPERSSSDPGRWRIQQGSRRVQPGTQRIQRSAPRVQPSETRVQPAPRARSRDTRVQPSPPRVHSPGPQASRDNVKAHADRKRAERTQQSNGRGHR